MELEYVSSPSNVNAGSALKAVIDVGEEDFEAVLAWRVLRRLAKEVKHLQYHGTDYLLVRVDTTPL